MVRDIYKNGKQIKIAFCAKRIQKGLSFLQIEQEAAKIDLTVSKATYVFAKTCLKHNRPIAGVTYNYVKKFKSGTVVIKKRKSFPVTKPIYRDEAAKYFNLASVTLRNTVDVLKTIGYSRDKIVMLFINEIIGE
jgi:hypothetical protein